MDEGTTEHLQRVGSPQRTGRVFGSRYALYDEVGCGPLARVYGAWDNQLSHRVAIKILRSRFLDHQEVVQAFEVEGRRTAGLPSHRNIVSIHDVEREGQVPYVVMEYVPGRSVRSILDAEAPLAVDHAVDICHQVAQGLEFAHAYGIIHGNIRPENIIVSRDGQVKVTDFGMGHVMDVAETLGALPPVTRARYISPERALGRTPGPAADVFSLGVVLFELLTGRLPFLTGDVSSFPSNHARRSPRDPEIPQATWRTVQRALAKDPESRYRSAGAFAAALHEYLLVGAGLTAMNLPLSAINERLEQTGSEPSQEATPPTPTRSSTHSVRRVDRPARPHRVTVMTFVFVVVLAVALAGGWLTYRAISDLLKRWGPPIGARAGWTIKDLPPAQLSSFSHLKLAVTPRTYPYILDVTRTPDVRAGSECTSIQACSYSLQIAPSVTARQTRT